MVCSRLTSFLLGMLLSWLALQLHASATITRDNQELVQVKDFKVKVKMISTMRKMKNNTGKKMGIFIREEKKHTFQNTVDGPSFGKCGKGKFNSECKRSFVTGEAKTPPNKQIRQSNKVRKDNNFNVKIKGKAFETVEISKTTANNSPPNFPSSGSYQLQRIETVKFKEEETAVYTMMVKDYNVKAKHKPPINNHQPSEDNDEKP